MDFELKSRLKSGKTVIGPFVRLSEPAILEMLGYAGFDFCIIDLEHGPMSVHQAENLVRTARGVGISPIIRIRENEQTLALRAMDTGAAGIQIPQVNSAEMAEASVRFAKFHPHGERGVCRFTRAAHYSDIPREQYFQNSNASSVVVLQIEGLGGVNDIDRIVEIEGYDALFIGPYDLSQALGLTGQVSHPDVLKTIESITKKARDQGLVVGTFADCPESIGMYIDMGLQYLATYIDTGLFYQTSKDRVEEIRTMIAARNVIGL